MFHYASSADQQLLAEWRWLIGGLPQLIGWSSGGDLFIHTADGKIAMIDPGAGNVTVAADTLAAFRAQLEDADRSAELLQLALVRAFETSRNRLQPGCCLGFKQLPALGGSYDLENRFPLSITEHAAFTGDVHRQIRDLPDGAKVKFKIVP